MQTAEFICVWFELQQHVMLVDRRSVPSSGHDPKPVSPGWRLVACETAATAPAGPAAPANSTSVSAWPPFHPADLPLLVGPEQAPKQIQLFDFSPFQDTPFKPSASAQFILDPSLQIFAAHAWWVIACRDPDDAWEAGLFGPASYIARHALAAEPMPTLADEIVAEACGPPGMAAAVAYLVIPVAERRVGPAVLGHRRPSPTVRATVDVVLEPRSNGTSQPVVEMRTGPEIALSDVTGNVQCCILRRNAGSFDLPDFGCSMAGTGAEARSGAVVAIKLPEPIFHGDVIGIVSRGVAFTLAARLGVDAGQAIEAGDSWQTALFVRRENGVVAATEDRTLVLSGRLDELRETITAMVADMTMDRLLSSLKSQLKRQLMRTAIATSYLIDRDLAIRARAELSELLSDDSAVHLEHLAYAAASAQRLERLVAARQPLDSPLRQVADGVDEAALAACIADIAGFDDCNGAGPGEMLLHDVLRDPLAVQAVVNVASRSAALAHWNAAMAEWGLDRRDQKLAKIGDGPEAP